jgi:hypothetical protein
MSILGVAGPSSGVEAEYEYEYEYEKTSVFARIPAPMGRGYMLAVVRGWPYATVARSSWVVAQGWRCKAGWRKAPLAPRRPVS